MIDLIVLDVDGIMTDGKKAYNLSGNVVSKIFCDKDFTAIKRLKASGLKVCFLSGDNKINQQIAENRNIDFYYARGKDKASFIGQLTKVYNTIPERMLYIGDDLFDLSIMKLVGYPFCTVDSPDTLKKHCGPCNTVDRVGGQNVVARLVDMLLERNLIEDPNFKDIEKLDAKERF